MKTRHSIDLPILATAAAATAALAADESASVDDLVAKIVSGDDAVRGPAWQNAGRFGAPAVLPLGKVLDHPDTETARAAKRGLWRIVAYAGRPGATDERQEVARELVKLLTHSNTGNRHELLWMLSEIGDDKSVPPLAALLFNKDLCEDARTALQRVPGEKSLGALKVALEKVPEDYKPAIAVSLRARGEKVPGYPTGKLVPTKQTEVKPAAA